MPSIAKTSHASSPRTIHHGERHTIVRISFTPAENGFAFSNGFTNHVVRVPAVGVDITTRGRCGGMAAAAMDYWHAGLAMSTNSALPQDGSLVADYIYSRLMDTFVDNGLKFVQYATSLDHPTWLRGKGVARMTREDELPKLKARLNAGQPVLLGLTQARDVTQLGNDHQVVAYGWEQDSRYTYVLVYDNNNPGREVRLKLTTVDDPAERAITGSNGKTLARPLRRELHPQDRRASSRPAGSSTTRPTRRSW